MATGRLQVQLYDQSQAVPVVSGRVVVSSDGEVLYDVYTDNSGQTIEMELEAPPIEYSIDENEPQPYSTYTIQITAQEIGRAHV